MCFVIEYRYVFAELLAFYRECLGSICEFHRHDLGCARRKRSFTRTPSVSAEASRLLASKTNAAKVCVVYQKNMQKTMLLAGCALLLGTTVIASDFAADPLNFRNPQQDLIDNSSEMLRETKELQSCEKQQEEALQRFLEAGLSLNAAALMAHNQYPCD
jgi:hypothetical protein